MPHNSIRSQRIQLTVFLFCLLISVFFTHPTEAQFDFGDNVRVVDQQEEDGSINLYGDNTLPIPIYVYLSTTRAQNYTPSLPLPRSIVIPPQTENHPLFSFTITDNTQSSSIRYAYRFSVSDPARVVVHNNSYRYLFPYAHGQKLQVSQTHNGRYSHNNNTNRYAVDFNADIDTPVHATRGGLVVFVKEDSNRGGSSASYRNDANTIVLMHDDGTLGYYVHLRKDGALVEIGERVEVGQHIGYSGNTGRSSGPHIHFDVHVPLANGSSESIPVTFISANDEVIQMPEVGSYYYSVHPGGAPFETILGRYITVDSFDGYLNSTEPSNKLDVRTENIDNTILAFCLNGTADDLEVQIDFRISGLTSEIAYPINTVIPAESEIFCGLFRIAQYATRTRIEPRLTIIPAKEE